jgi:hypothetical protein
MCSCATGFYAAALPSGRDRTEGEGQMTDQLPNHRERQFMQYLRGVGWVKMTLLPDAPGLIKKLLEKGWIEQRTDASGVCYRLTDSGLVAKTTPSRAYGQPD